MSCCTTSRQNADPSAAAPAPRSGSGAQAGRVRFRGGPSFVGTDRPVLPQDGEGPKRPVTLAPFWLDTTTVTNAHFAAFVAATGYLTEAEHFGWSPVFRGLLGPDAPPPAASPTPWWVRIDGACWSAPEGPGSSIEGRETHPVVQISWHDAQAFAAWCGGRLPSEAEWEHAARGGLADPRFPWGDAEPDDQIVYANIWQGRFPHSNLLTDGYLGTSPVATFPANGAGLYDMAGNVWEWTSDPFRPPTPGHKEHADRTQEKILKGGSFLCHRSYCYRYRIAARSAMTSDSATSNAGFRIAYDSAAEGAQSEQPDR